MPSRCAMPCLKPGCPNLRRPPARYCDEHKDIAKTEYPRRHPEHQAMYNTKRWKDLRKWWLSGHPLCVLCEGIASVCDHKTPHKGNEELFYSVDNLQNLCREDHNKKTGKEFSWGRAGDKKY